jgi:hypothetical protein
MRAIIFIYLTNLIFAILQQDQNTFNDNIEIILKPSGNAIITDIIQRAVDKCASKGGGTVRFTAGTYRSGSIELKSKVTIKLDKEVILSGSDNYSDYRNDAFFYGKDLSGVTIEGDGTVDGVDCYNPEGEEGFRGPHCIKLINCTDIKLEGITIKNSANWAINCRNCSHGVVTNVTIRGGHDGLHTRFCDNFTVNGCDFRTGDDAFAGNDNRNFDISACLVNTSCNGFRLGCMNLTVKHCTLWGPGESVHKVQKRNNMLSAFVHFSPEDEHPKLLSGNWTIEDITVRDVDNFFIFNFKDGLWQTGQPFTSVSFDDIRADGLLKAFYIQGDSARNFNMNMKNSSFSYRKGEVKKNDFFEGVRLKSDEFFYANSFGSISMENVTFEKRDSSILMKAEYGNDINLYGVGFIKQSEKIPMEFGMIKKIRQNNYYIRNSK